MRNVNMIKEVSHSVIVLLKLRKIAWDCVTSERLLNYIEYVSRRVDRYMQYKGRLNIFKIKIINVGY